MKNYLNQLDSKFRKTIAIISQKADERQLKAYIVGGIVRDILLNRKIFDLDIMVEADAQELARAVAKALNADLKVYPDFKTATVILKNNRHIDFATARKETYAFSGALPQVSAGQLKDDLFRRDFTINAMAIGIHKDQFGVLIDQFGGQKDLNNKIIRILHARSFEDDPTRILRALRFEQRFSFKLEKETGALLKIAINKDYLKNISAQRYLNELKKIFCEEDVIKHLKRLKSSGCLDYLSNGLDIKWFLISCLEKNIKRHGIQDKEKRWFLFLLAILEHNVNAVNEVLDRFSFTGAQKNTLLQLSKVKAIMNSLLRPKLSRSQVFVELRPLSEGLIEYLFLSASKKIVFKRTGQFYKDRNNKLLITGNDLKHLGLDSGQKMGKILNQLLLEKIDQKISTRKAQLARAKVLAGSQ